MLARKRYQPTFRPKKRIEIERMADKKRPRSAVRTADEVRLTRRTFVFKGLALAAFTALTGRLWQLQVRDRQETRGLVRRLRARGLKTLDFSDNELAKLHVRHTVGGHAPTVDHEILYRFEFPERPGALMRFLTAMSSSWNISLFHYRNHGADYGRVLVGMQVPPRDKRKFRAFLSRVGYPFRDETRNPAYRLFLG